MMTKHKWTFYNIIVEKTCLKSDYIFCFGKTTQRLLTRACSLEANVFKSSYFCQPLIEGNFTLKRRKRKNANCRCSTTMYSVIYIHTLCMRGAKALASLHICKPSLLDNAISTKSHALD